MLRADRAMHEVSFLQDLAVVMIAAGIVTVLFQRLKQPVVLGYIVAGILIGPHLLELIKEQDAIKSLAELGMVFLMFSLGRPDVWPIGDYGIQKGAQQEYSVDGVAELSALGDRFAPYRSAAAIYLWRAID